MNKIVILKDRQSLTRDLNGLRCEVVKEEDYTTQAGINYNFKLLQSEHNPDNVLALITKWTNRGQTKEEFVCFMPDDFAPGDRGATSFLFDGNNFISEINDADSLFPKVSELYCEYKPITEKKATNPAYVAEYKTANAGKENPFVFVFETVNTHDGTSYVELYQGIQVSEREVIEL